MDKVYCNHCKWLRTTGVTLTGYECHAPNNMLPTWFSPQGKTDKEPRTKNADNHCIDYEYKV